jgi:hypothetical protein
MALQEKERRAEMRYVAAVVFFWSTTSQHQLGLLALLFVLW